MSYPREIKDAYQRARRDSLRRLQLCINGLTHGPQVPRSGGRCARCLIVKRRGADHPDVAAYDASEAGQRWHTARRELAAMARTGALGPALPGRLPRTHPNTGPDRTSHQA